jgi:hypothetical protein
MGLNVPRDVTGALGAEEEQQLHEMWDTADDVEVDLQRDGVMLLCKPECPMPYVNAYVLTEAADREFEIIFAQVGEWFGYLSNLLARTKVRQIQAETEEDELKRKMRRRLYTHYEAKAQKRPAAKELEDSVEDNDRACALRQEAQYYRQRAIELSSLVDKFERDWKTVSREVEIRKLVIEATVRGSNIGSRMTHQDLARRTSQTFEDSR